MTAPGLGECRFGFVRIFYQKHLTLLAHYCVIMRIFKDEQA